MGFLAGYVFRRKLGAKHTQNFYKAAKEETISIRKTQEWINSISRIEDLEELKTTLLFHLKENFMFQSPKLFLVDFETGKIESSCFNEEGTITKEKIDTSIFKEVDDTSSILLQTLAFKIKEPIVVSKGKIITTAKDITEKNFKNNNYLHESKKGLGFAFVPILYRAKRPIDQIPIQTFLKSPPTKEADEDNDFPMGLVEVRFRYKNYYPSKRNTADILKKRELRNKIENLYVYLDNFSQPYYRAYTSYEKKKIKDLIYNKSISNYRYFLNSTLKSLTDLLTFPYGCISLLDLNNNIQLLNENLDFMVGYNFSEKRISEINAILLENQKSGKFIGITNRVINDRKTIVVNDIGNTEQQKDYLGICPDIRSEICIPMITPKDNLIGTLSISSKNYKVFNKLYIELLEYAAVEITSRLLTAKRYTSIKELNKPIDIFNIEPHAILNSLLAHVKDYFNTKEVLFLERSEANDYNEFSVVKGLNSNTINKSRNIINSLKLNEKDTFIIENDINLGHYKSDDDIAIVLNCKEEIQSNKSLDTYSKKLGFQSLIIIRIPINNKYKFLFVIGSHRELQQNNIKEICGEFISGLREKFENTYLLHLLINILSENEVSQVSNLYRLVASNIQNFLNASVVGVIPFDRRHNLFNHKEVVIIGEEWEKFKDNRLILSELIINDTSKYFNSKKEFIDYIKEKSGDLPEDSFLKKSKIESIAALKLEFEDVFLGTLMIEFNAPKKFSGKILDIIHSFKKVTERLLFFKLELSEQIALYEREKAGALKSIELAEKKGKELQKDIDEYREVVEGLQTRAAAVSYFEISRIIHHDIYHLFARLSDITIKMDINNNDHVRIKKSIEEIRSFIHELLEMTNFSRSERVFFDVNNLIRFLVRFLKKDREKHILFNTKNLDTTLPHLKWNKAEFSMVLYNLISNAIYALENYENADSFQREIKVSTNYEKAEGTYIISVWDNGPGIKKDNIDKIYNLKYSTKSKDMLQLEDYSGEKPTSLGHGIGLYFVKNALFNENTDFAADIHCTSTLGEFTEFIITIPEYLNNK